MWDVGFVVDEVVRGPVFLRVLPCWFLAIASAVYARNSYFTLQLCRPFCFNAHYQYTQLFNLRPLIFGVTPLWLAALYLHKPLRIPLFLMGISFFVYIFLFTPGISGTRLRR